MSIYIGCKSDEGLCAGSPSYLLLVVVSEQVSGRLAFRSRCYTSVKELFVFI